MYTYKNRALKSSERLRSLHNPRILRGQNTEITARVFLARREQLVPDFANCAGCLPGSMLELLYACSDIATIK